MAGLPVTDGAVQLTSILVVESVDPVTVGASGASGGSNSSVTFMVRLCVASTVPSFTVTVVAKLDFASWSSVAPDCHLDHTIRTNVERTVGRRVE